MVLWWGSASVKQCDISTTQECHINATQYHSKTTQEYHRNTTQYCCVVLLCGWPPSLNQTQNNPRYRWNDLPLHFPSVQKTTRNITTLTLTGYPRWHVISWVTLHYCPSTKVPTHHWCTKTCMCNQTSMKIEAFCTILPCHFLLFLSVERFILHMSLLLVP